MAGSSQRVKRTNEYRDIFFWLLLLGSWQFLTAPGEKNAMCGAGGTAAFLVFAYRNLGRLRGLGLDYAGWRNTTRVRWLVAAVSGLAAGVAVFGIGSATRQNMALSSNWRLVLLQVTLGPVLEELVFRGYVFTVLAWSLKRIVDDLALHRLVVVISAVVFALAHLAQPGVNWLQLACVTFTGTLYGWIRYHSDSTAAAPATHAVYNLTLYAAAGILAVLLQKAST
jgi:membrane protease YdiL (CAAX protease family)